MPNRQALMVIRTAMMEEGDDGNDGIEYYVFVDNINDDNDNLVQQIFSFFTLMKHYQ